MILTPVASHEQVSWQTTLNALSTDLKEVVPKQPSCWIILLMTTDATRVVHNWLVGFSETILIRLFGGNKQHASKPVPCWLWLAGCSPHYWVFRVLRGFQVKPSKRVNQDWNVSSTVEFSKQYPRNVMHMVFIQVVDLHEFVNDNQHSSNWYFQYLLVSSLPWASVCHFNSAVHDLQR